MDFRLLGPLEVLGYDGAPVQLGGVRPRALLAQLLLHANEAVSTDRLIDGIWGESPPGSDLGALQVHVHALRKALGADRILTRPPGYVVRVEKDELDLLRFERLLENHPREALALVFGAKLDGAIIGGNPDWLRRRHAEGRRVEDDGCQGLARRRDPSQLASNRLLLASGSHRSGVRGPSDRLLLALGGADPSSRRARS